MVVTRGQAIDAMVAVARQCCRPGSDLARVADIAAEYATIADAHRVLLAADADGRLELRPETSYDMLGPAERAAAIPGPRGSLLTWVRVVA